MHAVCLARFALQKFHSVEEEAAGEHIQQEQAEEEWGGREIEQTK